MEGGRTACNSGRQEIIAKVKKKTIDELISSRILDQCLFGKRLCCM